MSLACLPHPSCGREASGQVKHEHLLSSGVNGAVASVGSCEVRTEDYLRVVVACRTQDKREAAAAALRRGGGRAQTTHNPTNCGSSARCLCCQQPHVCEFRSQRLKHHRRVLPVRSLTTTTAAAAEQQQISRHPGGRPRQAAAAPEFIHQECGAAITPLHTT